ncbi:MAG: hypothetical protein UX99_C0012G0006 [Candidatus Amesbacteria bacterium GW2011_GWB1_47_26]|uniref:Uncharacterized protein n=1 Tax=Candidatus Amesbacteria bacterium GW2011_GWC2_45_19 TaxID=1618366 RepID=A0A0G1M384_9BACT|nr:MAG: hypothetical protein UX05_C0009G0012 [Candidatus Amesbacteria bacterium GW2011_GWC2_45_19]KKU37829.1 MAG: hypothetical protein UX52_C0017G0016 [Candidatus Amesbacteria bacterium GW2011_GWA1_46_35]KKU69369.1 MAG: hypothetical protein UX93_C0002G0208 [Microgenomates group bacterium GW2011_GWC1_47_20]KKU74521.1 MAG: hypothetical protein UX99_C0012G0006 [Candidatus Amesbacteria bacterium GW2011_GWB1_47_26]KKU78581.1 MAG: hypothetical protein UY06_C0046G0001 [Candidatus Amesbacteria bacteriu
MKQLAQITGIDDPVGTKFPIADYADLPGLIVSRLLTFAIIGAGLFFFVRLISAGYSYLTSLGEPAKIQSATKELTNAVIGLLVIISSYFIIQIIEVVFGFNILKP